MLQLPSERIWPSQLVQRHSAATWRHDSLAASTIEAGHHPRSAEMSAATKYAPQADSTQLSAQVAFRASVSVPYSFLILRSVVRGCSQGCFINK